MEETQNLIERLNLSGKRLSKSHRRIAEYIMAHYDKAVFMTAATLGEMVGVSESTVVRFAMALGYEGYQQSRFIILYRYDRYFYESPLFS